MNVLSVDEVLLKGVDKGGIFRMQNFDVTNPSPMCLYGVSPFTSFHF